MPAGFYEVTAEMLTVGEFWRNPMSRYLTADGSKEYEFVLTPEITSINSNSAGENGNRLVISGNGFNNDKTKSTVSVGDLNCNVTE